MFRAFVKIVILSATPITIFYPFPIIPFVIFSLSSVEYQLSSLLTLILFTFVFFAGVNLWNHVNDVEEDKISGRNNLFVESECLRRIGILVSILLYAISITYFLKYSTDSKAFLPFFVTCILTWVYSDKIFIGRYIKRLKQDYRTEFLTYLVSYPLFILSLWSLNSELNIISIFIAFWFVFFGLWNILLKDIKDMSADEKAGLNTVAIKLGYKKCLEYSTYSILIFYFLIIPYSIIEIIPPISITLSVFIIIPMYIYLKLRQINWEITPEFAGKFSLLAKSNIFLLLIIGILEIVSSYLRYLF